MLDPHEIDEISFKKSFMGGYNEEEVDNFIFNLSGDYKKLYSENGDLKKKLTILAEKVEEYRQQENSIKNAVLYAQKLRDEAIIESEAKSKELIEAAEIRAKELIDNIEIKAAQMRADEEKFLEKTVRENRHAIEKENIALNIIKKEVSEFKLRLQELYKSHLKTILSMPNYEEPAVNEVAETKREEIKSDSENTNEPILQQTENTDEANTVTVDEQAEVNSEIEKPNSGISVNKSKVNLVLDIEDTSEIKPVNIDFKIKDKDKSGK